jgi:hypothetical protein
MTLVFKQAAPFTGPAYQYLRADDQLPSYRDIAHEPDPLCRVKLFQPGSRWIYYACAAANTGADPAARWLDAQLHGGRRRGGATRRVVAWARSAVEAAHC